MKIYKKLIDIQIALKCNKSNNNSFGGYKYRKAEDILLAVKPLLAENNATLLLNNEIVNVEGRFYVKSIARLIDIETGDVVEATAYAREEETKAKMDGSQATGSSASYANKYALGNLFAICEVDDSDTTCTHGKTNENNNKKAEYSENSSTKSNKSISEAQFKRLLAIANKAGIKKDQVEKVIHKEYGLSDIMSLSKEQYDAICERLEAKSK